tara:strand:- start:388 stop:771 length:384 start_codon:yes stop_codon:yes gene_type:complete
MQANYEKLTIRSVKLTQSKKGDNFIVVEGVTDAGVWVKEWIGKNAPAFVIDRWWKSVGIAHNGWESYCTELAFELIGKEVLVELKDGNYGKDVEEVRALDYVAKTQEKPAKTDSPKPMKPVEDDLPF